MVRPDSSKDISKKVRSAVIKSRTTLSGVRAGLFRVHAHGSGYDFDQLSEYHDGGDFRRIDWKSSARTNSLLLREYKDEQNRTIHVMVDVSASMEYGTGELLVSGVASELAQALKIISSGADDTFCEHRVHPFLSSWKEIFEQFSLRHRRRALLIIISDFIVADDAVAEYESALRVLARQHELIIIRVRDHRENFIFGASISFMCKDSEQAQSFCTQSDSVGIQEAQIWRAEQAAFFRKCKIPLFDCYAGCEPDDENHIERLVTFLRKNA